MDKQSDIVLKIARDLYPNYDHLEPLGQGGMGDIYRGRKTNLNLPVVIKIIKSKFKGRLNERQEADILKGLKHKYLPRVYDVIESRDGYLYTIMDYIPGINMKDYVKKNGPADQKTVYRWAVQLCDVVSYLHEQTPPIIHSDIKPSNLMITPNGDICLIDFNTSMELRAGMTAIGKTKGYAAPEQYTKPEHMLRHMQEDAGLMASVDENTILGEESSAEDTILMNTENNAKSGTTTGRPSTGSSELVFSRFFRSSALSAAASTDAAKQPYYGTLTKRTDVFAVGATLYFALTGFDPPHSLEPARPLSVFKLPISKSLVQIIERSMQKDPKDRFRDAEELGRAFREIHRLDGNYRRIRILTAAAVLLEVLLFGGGIGLMLLGSSRLEQERFIAYMNLLQEAQMRKNQGEYAEAAELTRDAQNLIDTRVEAYVEEAVVYYNRGAAAISAEERNTSFRQCIHKVNEILSNELVGGTPGEWNKLFFAGAESCMELEDYAQAARWYRSGIDYLPTEACYKGLIFAQVFMKDNQAAKAVLDELRMTLPDADTEASAEMIDAELDSLDGDYSGALQHYRRLVTLTNDGKVLERAYLAANTACVSGGVALVAERIEILEEACERLPAAKTVFIPLLANAYYMQYLNDPQDEPARDRAMELFIQLGPDNLNFEDRLELNELRVESGMYDEAEQDLLLMQERSPGNYNVTKHLFDVYWKQFEQELQNRSKKITLLEKAWNCYLQAKEEYEATKQENPKMIQLIYEMESLRPMVESYLS